MLGFGIRATTLANEVAANKKKEQIYVAIKHASDAEVVH